jgi:putative phosphoesterase
LAGSRQIVHAGDIGEPAILDALRGIAPVTAVRGNNDKGAWAEGIPVDAVLQVGAIRIYAIHDLAELDFDPAVAGFQVVVAGHSHKPRQEMRDGVLYINPGSAGPRRFTLPVALARLDIVGANVAPQLIELAI